MNRKLLTMAEFAEICDINLQQAYALARAGIIPVVQLGRQLRVHPDRLEEFLRNGGQAYEGGWRREAL